MAGEEADAYVTVDFNEWLYERAESNDVLTKSFESWFEESGHTYPDNDALRAFFMDYFGERGMTLENYVWANRENPFLDDDDFTLVKSAHGQFVFITGANGSYIKFGTGKVLTVTGDDGCFDDFERYAGHCTHGHFNEYSGNHLMSVDGSVRSSTLSLQVKFTDWQDGEVNDAAKYIIACGKRNCGGNVEQFWTA